MLQLESFHKVTLHLCSGEVSSVIQPCDIGNVLDEGVAQRVAPYLQNAAANEQEKQEGAAHHHDPVYPHAVPAKQSKVDKRQSHFYAQKLKISSRE